MAWGACGEGLRGSAPDGPAGADPVTHVLATRTRASSRVSSATAADRHAPSQPWAPEAGFSRRRATIEDPPVVQKILAHLGLPALPEARPARPPPGWSDTLAFAFPG